MAPKRGVKRAAEAAPAGEPPAKYPPSLTKQGITAYKRVAEVFQGPLAELVELSPESSELLMGMLRHSLSVPVDERQEVQKHAVNLIEDHLSRVLACMQTSLEAEASKAEAAEAVKAEHEQKIQAAVQVQKAAQVPAREEQAAFDAANVAASAAADGLAQMEEEQRGVEAKLLDMEADKSALEASRDGDFKKLKLGDWEEGESEELYTAVEAFFPKLALDMSLRDAIRPALTKRATERGTFDNKAVDQLERCFESQIEHLADTLAAGPADKEARATAVEQARLSSEAAEEKKKAAAESLEVAKTKLKESEAEVKSAKAALTEFQPEYKAATELRNSWQKKIQNYIDVTMDAFSSLKEMISATLAAAEAEAAAAAKAEAAAAAEAEAAAAAEAEAAAAEAEAAATEEAEAAAAAESEATDAGHAEAAPEQVTAVEVPSAPAAKVPEASEEVDREAAALVGGA